jgi:transcription initiation factor IIE alpha subunit
MSLNLNETVIKKIVREEMEDVVRSVIEEYLDKSLVTEDIQIRVGGTTFSGKLKPLPQKRR